MKLSRSPPYFTNEREVEASPSTIWSLLADVAAWPSFSPAASKIAVARERARA